MFGRGARSAMGGMPGDSYVFYKGMDADQEKGISALFNDAEVISFYILSVLILIIENTGFYGTFRSCQNS